MNRFTHRSIQAVAKITYEGHHEGIYPVPFTSRKGRIHPTTAGTGNIKEARPEIRQTHVRNPRIRFALVLDVPSASPGSLEHVTNQILPYVLLKRSNGSIYGLILIQVDESLGFGTQNFHGNKEEAPKIIRCKSRATISRTPTRFN